MELLLSFSVIQIMKVQPGECKVGLVSKGEQVTLPSIICACNTKTRVKREFSLTSLFLLAAAAASGPSLGKVFRRDYL